MKLFLQLFVSLVGAYLGIVMCKGFSLGAFWAGVCTTMFVLILEEKI